MLPTSNVRCRCAAVNLAVNHNYSVVLFVADSIIQPLVMAPLDMSLTIAVI